MKIYVLTHLEESWDGHEEEYYESSPCEAYVDKDKANAAAAKMWGGAVYEIELNLDCVEAGKVRAISEKWGYGAFAFCTLPKRAQWITR